MGYAIGAVPAGSAEDPCCCTPPPDCCLYPWPDPDGIAGGPYYPDTDLPDSVIVTISGTPYTLPRVGYNFELNDAGDIYLVEAQLADTFWILRKNGDPRGTNACLIGDYDTNTVEDEFTDTYTGKYGVFDDVTLTRINLCEWYAEQDVSGDLYSYLVRYESTGYKWNVQISLNGTPIVDWVKDDPQSSPEGDYNGGDFVVSP